MQMNHVKIHATKSVQRGSAGCLFTRHPSGEKKSAVSLVKKQPREATKDRVEISRVELSTFLHG